MLIHIHKICYYSKYSNFIVNILLNFNKSKYKQNNSILTIIIFFLRIEANYNKQTSYNKIEIVELTKVTIFYIIGLIKNKCILFLVNYFLIN